MIVSVESPQLKESDRINSGIVLQSTVMSTLSEALHSAESSI